jgi:hypothetical protein
MKGCCISLQHDILNLVECTQLSTSDVKEREIKKEIKKTL